MKKINLWRAFLVCAMGLGLAACGDDGDDGKNSSLPGETQIKACLESGSGIWKVTEYNNGKTTVFHITFKNGKTSGYTFAGPNGSPVDVTYGIKGNFVYQTDKSHYEVLEGGIYIQEITSTTFKGYWCGNIQLSGEKIESAPLTLNGQWEGYISNYYYDRWGLTGDNYRTCIQLVQRESYSGSGFEVDYDIYDRWGSYYYSPIEWEVRNGIIRIHYIYDNEYVEISRYTLSRDRFNGYMYDGTHRDIEFSLSYVGNIDWSHYQLGRNWRKSSTKIPSF